jgi:hypothetical protein
VLAFASTFIILLTLLSTVVFAQSPIYDYTTDGETEFQGSCFIYFCETGTTDPLVIFNCVYNLSPGFMIQNTPVTDYNIILTDAFYQNYIYNFTSSDLVLTDIEIDEIIDNFENDGLDTYYYFKTNKGGNYRDEYLELNQEVLTDTIQLINEYKEDNGQSLQIPFIDYNRFISILRSSINEQFTFWYNQIQNNQGGYDSGYNIGYSEGITVGYTNALNDFDMFERGLFDIFNAPFIFVRNIVGFEIFGITISDVIIGVLLLCLGFVLIKFIGGAIPL